MGVTPYSVRPEPVLSEAEGPVEGFRRADHPEPHAPAGESKDNEVPSVNRVVYDITSKPPGTIEWE